MGFTDEMSAEIYNACKGMAKPVSSDVSGWDWSVQQWMLDDEATFTINQCQNPFDEWEFLVNQAAYIEGNSIYCTSDGILMELAIKGNQNSGKFKTSKSNSFMRNHVAHIIGSEYSFSMGDDAIEEWAPCAVEIYDTLGIKVKVYDEVIDDFEFCSKIFTKNGSYPVNYRKSLMNLLHAPVKNWFSWKCYMLGFEDEMRNHPQYKEIMNIVHETGFAYEEGEQIYCSEEDEQF
jgi:hypothetical protein